MVWEKDISNGLKTGINFNNWRMGEWLKPADCKSALRTGTGVRIPLLQQFKKYAGVAERGVYNLETCRNTSKVMKPKRSS